MAPDVTLISVDSIDSSFEDGYHKWREYLYMSFASKEQEIHLDRSYSFETFEKVKNLLGNNKLDSLPYCSNRTYEDIRKDFEVYFLIIRKGGMIAFHDIVPHAPKMRYEVSKFCKDLKQGWTGIGVIYI